MSVHGQVKPSFTENAEFDESLSAKRITEIPSNQQARWVYNEAGQCIYAGYAARGIDTSAVGWLLQKFTWDGDNCTVRQIAYDSFDNYLTATYS
jgi:hypothetical protein